MHEGLEHTCSMNVKIKPNSLLQDKLYPLTFCTKELFSRLLYFAKICQLHTITHTRTHTNKQSFFCLKKTALKFCFTYPSFYNKPPKCRELIQNAVFSVQGYVGEQKCFKHLNILVYFLIYTEMYMYNKTYREPFKVLNDHRE